MRTLVRVSVVTICALLFCLGVMFAQEKPKEETKAPSFTLEQREHIEAQQKKGLRIQLQLQQIQDKYNNMLRNDPQWVDLNNQNAENNRELNAYVQEALKGYDLSKWTVNYDSLGITPAKTPTPPATPPPANPPK